MEVFIYILSFISGGVVLTVAYIYQLTTKTKEKQDRLLSFQQNLQSIQSDHFENYKSGLESAYTELSGIKKGLSEDGYRNLREQSKLQKTAEIRIKTLEAENRKIREDMEANMNRVMGDIQKINSWKTSVQNDPNVINRY